MKKNTSFIVIGILLLGCCTSVCAQIPIRQNGKWGYIYEGKIFIAFKYDLAYTFDFDTGLAIVELGGKQGCIDRKGNEVIPFKYDKIYPFRESGLAIVALNKKFGLMDKDGTEILPCKYDKVSNLCVLNYYYYHKGLRQDVPAVRYGYIVELDGKCGLINEKGDEVISCKYDEISSFSQGYFAARLNNKWGLVNIIGEEKVPCEYDKFLNFDDKNNANFELNGEIKSHPTYKFTNR